MRLAGLVGLDMRSRWRRSPVAVIGMIALVAVTGAFAIGSAVAARHTAAGYSQLRRDIDAPDLLVVFGCVDDGFGGCRESALAPEGAGDDLARHPAVERIDTVNVLRPVLETLDGANPAVTPDNETGCIDQERGPALLARRAGGPSDQQLPFRLDGTLPALGGTEVVLSRATAERVGVGIGDTIILKGWCQTAEGEAALLDDPLPLTISGLMVGPLDIEPPGEGFTVEPLYTDAAVYARLVGAGASPDQLTSVWLVPGASPASLDDLGDRMRVVFDLVERERIVGAALRDDSRLLWAFAALVLGASALVLTPVIARHVRDSSSNPATLAALGASGAQRAGLAVAHATALVAAGAAIGGAGAGLVSPLLPRGLGDAVEPGSGPWFDPTLAVLGIGVMVAGAAVIAAIGAGLRGLANRPRTLATRPRVAARAVGRLSLAPPEHTGVRAALGSDGSRSGSVGWATLMSAALTVAVVVASTTFVASLRHLERSPRLIGWNWDGVVDVADDADDVDGVIDALEATAGVVVVTRGTLYPPVQLQHPATGTPVWPWSFDTGPGAIEPTVIEGRAAAGPDELAVDVVMARTLDLAPGDTVDLVRPQLAKLVAENLDFEGIAIPPFEVEPVPFRFTVTGIVVIAQRFAEPSPQAVLTLAGMRELTTPRPGELEAALAVVPADPPELRVDVERQLMTSIGRDAYIRIEGDPRAVAERIRAIHDVEQVIVPTPDAVVNNLAGLNLTRTDRVPMLLARAMALMGAVVLVYLILTGVLARRGELARLRSLGFRRADALRSALSQAVVVTAAVLAVATATGLVAGRWVWTSYARHLDLVPEPATPWGGLGVLAGVAIVLGSGAAVVAGAVATRRPPAADLRSE